ncbi:MAG TPA: chemotaxis protein CheX [Phycisphaerae bacterium]|jgi:chemotaxis protein CheX|nr:chemotaxis protein CheX [Phycisphaerae bacterium]
MEFELPILSQLVCSIWETVLKMPLQPATRPADPPAGRTTAACVQITGAWNGAVLLDCSADVARQAAAIMFGMDPKAVSVPELQDAVAELVNMIGGNFKALLPAKSFLSLPAVIEGGDFSSRIPGSRLAGRLDFSCGTDQVTITIREKEPQKAAAAA